MHQIRIDVRDDDLDVLREDASSEHRSVHEQASWWVHQKAVARRAQLATDASEPVVEVA